MKEENINDVLNYEKAVQNARQIYKQDTFKTLSQKDIQKFIDNLIGSGLFKRNKVQIAEIDDGSMFHKGYRIIPYRELFWDEIDKIQKYLKIPYQFFSGKRYIFY
jgi:hypothetical protein